MQKEQKQTHHGGTGAQETELGSAPDEKRPEDPTTLETGESDEDSRLRNPSGDDLRDAARRRRQRTHDLTDIHFVRV